MIFIDIIAIASFIVGVGGFIVAIISIADARKSKSRIKQVTEIINTEITGRDDITSLYKRLSDLCNIPQFSEIPEHTQNILKRSILSLRNDLERHLRRISLFVKDKNLVQTSVFWFTENAITEDKKYLVVALNRKYIKDKIMRDTLGGIIEDL